MSPSRRDFLKGAGGLAVFAGVKGALAGRAEAAGSIAILPDPADAMATSVPVLWAAGELRKAIAAKQAAARVVSSLAAARTSHLCIVASRKPEGLLGGLSPAGAAEWQYSPGLPPESFRISPANVVVSRASGASTTHLLVRASDQSGFVYALLELADRVRHGADPLTALSASPATQESPANEVRSITRAFVSEVEDKPWYYDRDFWRAYLSMLAAQRFNRFNLAFGIGYDFARQITDDYFHFAYPFLVNVPGYDVRVVPLSAEERDRNLEMLRFISGETAARGLEFHLGLWTHAYEWRDSPHAAHRVEGLTAQTQAPYCRDALALLLKNCPAISGLTFRVHGESGVAEGSYDFWRTLFSAMKGGAAGRTVSLDLHAKGLDDRMIAVALDTGMPVSVSPKFWAEHMGLGYHQSAIRELEMPPRNAPTRGLFSLSEGSRSFMRYGYGDMFRRDRKYKIVFRLWPGTQRTLLWGDPVMAAAYGRAPHFCGASGMEICEPLFFKGRKGSGLPGGRCAYADASLDPSRDFEKYLYAYRLWGRLLYDPEAAPETWRRPLRAQFGASASAVEEALANAGRVLPLITTAHLPSAANNTYWPEIYTNMPIVAGSSPDIYGDSPRPRRFGTVSPIDPGLFATIEEYAAELLGGNSSGKYSPLEVAQWLEDFTSRAQSHLDAARKLVAPASGSAEFRRFAADAAIQIGLGRFFAAKFRAGALFAIWQQSGNAKALAEAVALYQKAREEWSAFAEPARSVYRADITYGPDPNQRGNWLDRLPAMDKDIAAMEVLLANPAGAATASADPARATLAIQQCLGRFERPSVACRHVPPKSFRPGDSLGLEIVAGSATHFAPAESDGPLQGALHYRHVNQAEDWQTLEASPTGTRFTAAIPAAYTNSPFPLQYYFSFRRVSGLAWLYPELGPDLARQPYFVIPQA